MSAPAPIPAGPGGFQSKGGPRGRYAANLRKYGTPLPILLASSPSLPAKSDNTSAASSNTFLSSFIPTLFTSTFAASRIVEIPTCIGVFDASTQSVWVSDPQDMAILFNRGFFGKGSLSRSEPSWRQRRIDLLKGGSTFAAEQMREKRRLERKQFKIDRAAAMLDAAKKAEAVLTTGQMPDGYTATDDVVDCTTPEAGSSGVAMEDDLTTSALGSPAPSNLSLATDYTTQLPPGTKLTPQTFLVRPTRPDANRNRGRNAFKRRPPQPKDKPQSQINGQAQSQGDAEANSNTTGASSSTLMQSAQRPAPPPVAEPSDSDSEDDLIDGLVEDMEHLQLSLEEAWFLSAGLGVLKVLDPNTQTYPPTQSILSLFLSPPEPEQTLSPPTNLYPDDPLLVSYACYHHYRSLGWVIRPGVKFCVDWLLYRRGPVFSHSAFSVLMVPVYMDDTDKALSPYGKTDWYDERMSWKWMNTIMRVNSLVLKTVVIAYITIPAMSSFSDSVKRPDGTLDPRKFDMRSLMAKYSVREVSLTRFGIARRRD